MGDRALILFTHVDPHSQTILYSPVTYLHWGGSSVPALLDKCRQLMESRGPDLDYTTARFIGICHAMDPDSNLSLGVWNAENGMADWTKEQWEEYSHGDGGVVIVDLTDWSVRCYGGYLTNASYWRHVQTTIHRCTAPQKA